MIPSYMLTPGYNPREESMRRKAAYALMMQGSSGEPVQHWTQGLARMAQGALGGYEIYKDNEETNARESRIAAALSGLPGLGDEPPATPAPMPAPPQQAPAGPSEMPPMSGAGRVYSANEYNPIDAKLDTEKPRARVVAALQTATDTPVAMPPPAAPVTGNRAAVTPTPKVWGDKEAEDAGLYPPAAQPTSGRIAQALQPPPQRNVPTIPPAEGATIRRLLADPATRAIGMQRYEKLMTPKDQQRPLTDPAERARYGIGPDDKTPYQVGADNKVAPINPQPFQVNVNQQQESEFKKKAGQLQAERFDKLVQGGMEAQGIVADLNALKEIGGRITTGKVAEIQAALGPYAEAVGIKMDNLDDQQAYKAIVAKLAPRMRVAGSGATSDFEMRQFLEALPGLGKTPMGNEIISNTMQAISQHRIQAAEIASRALAGDLPQREAEKMLRDLPDPLELWKKQGKALKPVSAPSSIDDLVKKHTR